MNEKELAVLDKVKPLCIDCKHYEDHDGWATPTCKIAVLGCEPVQGIITYNTCSKERNVGIHGHCGESGTNFEPKPEPKAKSWFDRLIAFLSESFDDEEIV